MPSIKNITGLYDNRMQEEKIITLKMPANILTPREIEYLALAALGFKNLQIAEILVVTQSTVKKMLESIFSKLNAKDRTHAVTICFLHELLSGSYLNEIISKYNLKDLISVNNTRKKSRR